MEISSNLFQNAIKILHKHKNIKHKHFSILLLKIYSQCTSQYTS